MWGISSDDEVPRDFRLAASDGGGPLDPEQTSTYAKINKTEIFSKRRKNQVFGFKFSGS
jgi:hypothetical protein